jgi:hypothetical protein
MHPGVGFAVAKALGFRLGCDVVTHGFTVDG